MYLKEKSSFNGCIASNGKVYIELDEDSVWTLTGDSEVTSVTCDEDAINLNGYTLKVNGKVYEEGTACSGEAIEIVAPASSQMEKMPFGDGKEGPPAEGMEPPKDGEQPPGKPEGMKEGEQPPERPEGMKEGEQPPEKPEGMKEGEQPPEMLGGNGVPPEKSE